MKADKRLTPTGDAVNEVLASLATARVAIDESTALLARLKSEDPILDVVDALPERLRKIAMREARCSAIEGATKIGRRWVARKSSIDAWLAGLGKRDARPETTDLHEALGLRRSA